MNMWPTKITSNQKGFSLPEAMLGIFLLGGVAVAGMKLANNMQSGTELVKGSNELNRTMMEIRNLITNPKVCNDNIGLGSVAQDTVLQGIVDTSATLNPRTGMPQTGQVPELKFKVGSTVPVASGYYLIENIKISKVDAAKRRAYIAFTFKHADQKGVVTTVTKNVSVFVKATGTTIDECIDPNDVIATSVSMKLCYDADPINFDADPDTNTDCADNVANLKAQVKRLYCETHPFFRYAGGKCLPLDAGVDCGNGRFVKGFSPTGTVICYTPTVPAAPVNPSP